MAKIAWLGTGMMGSAFVAALRRHGDGVVVWNRTQERAERLRTLGVHVAHTPRDAVKGADRVHSMLADDATVDALIDQLEGHLAPGTPFIDHTTVAPRPTTARFQRCEQAGIEFLHAPVFASPGMVRESKGIMLCSGPQPRFKRVRTELAKLTTDLWYLGERPDKAAAFKLCGNEMLFFIIAGLRDVYALAKSVGIPAAEAHELFAHFNPSGAIQSRGKSMVARDFTASFELVMARKDARLMVETAQQGGVELGALPCIAKEFDEALARGEGRHDVSVIAREVVT